VSEGAEDSSTGVGSGGRAPGGEEASGNGPAPGNAKGGVAAAAGAAARVLDPPLATSWSTTTGYPVILVIREPISVKAMGD